MSQPLLSPAAPLGDRAPLAPLSARLRATVLRHSSEPTLTCVFEAGGKLHGIGIPSALYCKRCGHARVWHDVAEAAVMAAAVEDSHRLPFGGHEEAAASR